MEHLIEKWTVLQTEMAKQVFIPQTRTDFQSNDLVLTLDIQYEGEKAYIAGDVQRQNGTSEGIFLKQDVVTEAYVPQFFAFREGPLLKRFVESWMMHTGLVLLELLELGQVRSKAFKMILMCTSQLLQNQWLILVLL